MSELRGRLHGDEPINSRASDLLGRTRFVERMAHDVLHAPAARGFIVSVMGEWGTGKTSVLRLVEETIGDRAVSLWFNPWLFSSTEELISRFFSEMAAQLEGYQDEEISNLAGRVASYGKALAPFAQILVPGLGTVMHAGAEAMRGAAEGKRVSTRERYNALADALAEFSKRVVVYVDDIDRLRDDEIREVMRLVKLVGDLPSVVYVLAYDRARVEQALGDDRQQGRAYIEKIVQLPHSVPRVRATQLYKLALDDMDAALGDEPFPFFDQRRWGELFRQGVAPMIETMRDARRYANVASLTARLVNEEVTGEDILALEALHVFEPDVHAALPRLANLLTKASRTIGNQQAADEEARATLRPVMEAARHPDAVKMLLSELFPAGAYLFGGTRYEPDQRDWRQARRVASSDVLDVFLHASFGEDAVATREVLDIVAALPDPATLRALLDAVPDDALNNLLDRVEDYRRDFQEADAAAMPVFVDLFPRLRLGPNFSLFPPEWALHTVLHSLLSAARPEARVSLVRSLFDGAPSLTARWYVSVWFTVSDEPSHADDEMRVLSQEMSEELGHDLRQRVIQATPESLVSEQQLLTVLLTLVRSDDDDEGREVARDKLSDDGLFLVLLVNAGLYSDWWGHLTRLVGGDWLAQRVHGLAASAGELDEEYKEAFERARRKVNGSAARDGPSASGA